MKAGHRVVLMYGLEKKDMGNIRPDELRQFKASVIFFLNLPMKYEWMCSVGPSLISSCSSLLICSTAYVVGLRKDSAASRQSPRAALPRKGVRTPPGVLFCQLWSPDGVLATGRLNGL